MEYFKSAALEAFFKESAADFPRPRFGRDLSASCAVLPNSGLSAETEIYLLPRLSRARKRSLARLCRQAYLHVYTRERRMPLNIRDDEVDRLAAQLAALNRTTKTQAVKDALRRELARVQQKKALWERVKPIRDEIAALPDSGIVIDKAFFDELNGETGE
jgi:antitoxin VapB